MQVGRRLPGHLLVVIPRPESPTGNLRLAQRDTKRERSNHHFQSKEDFGLQAIELYMTEVHAGLDRCLGAG